MHSEIVEEQGQSHMRVEEKFKTVLLDGGTIRSHQELRWGI